MLLKLNSFSTCARKYFLLTLLWISLFFHKTFMIRYLICWCIKKLENPGLYYSSSQWERSTREKLTRLYFFWKYDQDQVLFTNGIADGSEWWSQGISALVNLFTGGVRFLSKETLNKTTAAVETSSSSLERSNGIGKKGKSDSGQVNQGLVLWTRLPCCQTWEQN